MRQSYVFALLLSFAAAGGAAAQIAPSQQQQAASPPTYKGLLDQGYEIRAMTFIPADASSRIATSAQPDTMTIALQKGSMTATCWMAFAIWNNHQLNTLTCQVLR